MNKLIKVLVLLCVCALFGFGAYKSSQRANIVNLVGCLVVVAVSVGTSIWIMTRKVVKTTDETEQKPK